MKQIKKWLCLGLAAMMSMGVTSYATEAQQPDIASWAVNTLLEGENYLIYPVEWYYDNFQGPITVDKLTTLVTNVNAKIGAMGLPLKESVEIPQVKSNLTRQDVIEQLFNTLRPYEGVEATDAVAYFVEQGIVNGTDKGLELERVCTTQEAVLMAIQFLDHSYTAFDKAAKGFVWQTKHNDNEMYFIGTIHIGEPQLYPVDQRLKEVFDTADIILPEADLTKVAEQMPLFIQKATYADGTTLKDHVSEETYARVQEVSSLLGLPEGLMDAYKPWSVANDFNTLYLQSQQDPATQTQMVAPVPDQYFIARAYYGGQQIQELEGLPYQADLFNKLSAEYQEAYLNQSIDTIFAEEENKGLGEELVEEERIEYVWLENWIEGDIDAFTETYTLAAEGDDELTQLLLGERDEHMAEKLMALLEAEGDHTYVVVIGAGHFVTEDTVLYILEENGYEIERFYQ